MRKLHGFSTVYSSLLDAIAFRALVALKAIEQKNTSSLSKKRVRLVEGNYSNRLMQ